MITSLITPKKILAIKLRALGDTVIMSASLLALKKAYPNSEIDVLVTNTWASLLENHPAVNRIWKYERHKDAPSRAKAVAKLALKLRKEKYDCVVNFHASPSSSALAYALGSKVRSIHFHGHQDKNRYSTVTVPGKGELKPIIERDLDTVRALGVLIDEPYTPQIFLNEDEIKEAENRIQVLGLKKPILCLGIGASRSTKSWPLDRYASIAIRWCEDTNGSVICFNSREEELQAKSFFNFVDDKLAQWYQDTQKRKQVRSRIICETQISLRTMSALFKNSSVYLGNDSGPKHIAVASGLSSVTVFGPEDPFEWHPYPKDKHPIHYIEGLSCRKDHQPGFKPWCGLHECVVEEHRCMRQIAEDDVYRTVKNLYLKGTQ